MKFSWTAFPSLLVPVLLYAIAALSGGGGANFVESLAIPRLNIGMPSGLPWRLSAGDLFVLFGLGALFLDLLKATGTGAGTVVNHALGTGVFVLCLILFLLVPGFTSSTFFILLIMVLLDVMAGFTITIISARRDVSFGQG